MQIDLYSYIVAVVLVILLFVSVGAVAVLMARRNRPPTL